WRRRNSMGSRSVARSRSRRPAIRHLRRASPTARPAIRAVAGRFQPSCPVRKGHRTIERSITQRSFRPVRGTGHERAVPKTLIRLLPALCLLAALAAFPLRPAAAGATVTQFTLANGMDIVVIPDPRPPVVRHMVWYRAGAADEPMGKSGIAHFLEHLMFKGTARNPAGRFSQQVAAIGGQENAFTTNDYTGYFQRTSREHLEKLMDFEADRMTGLLLTGDVIASQRQVILEERNMRVDNEPAARLSEKMGAMQYLNHPYHHPTIGWRHEMESLDRADALAFYHRFYAPENAVLVVAGDVEPNEVKAMAERTYGKIPRHGPTV